MKEEWWEGPVCYLCDYWWALLLGLILALAAYFSREYWLPIFGLSPELEDVPAVTVSPVTEIPTAASQTPTMIPTVGLTASPTATPGSLAGYTNTSGKYAFNYPTAWEGIELEADAQFETPEGGVVYVHVEPRPQGETPAELSEASMEGLPYDVLESNETTVAGYPTLCQQMAYADEDQAIALTCYLIAEPQGYVLSLAYLDELTIEESQYVQAQFMDLVASFVIQP
jgi:hypothetical protein